MISMNKVYNHQTVEEKWYKFWEKKNFFKPKIDPKQKPFVIAMPPPNVTGELHLGHALTATIEDILIRFHRMSGVPTLWIPGVDHAGIATQVVVERELAKEGKSRQELGREEFLKRVWRWVEKYGNRIDEQHKKLGVSADWSRRKFTLAPGYQEAVKEAFRRLHQKGLIYQAERIINWCSRCATVLSDLEVVYREQKDPLYYIKYGPLTLATVRPETKFGDTALAINPNDKRYKKYVGQTLEIEDVLGKSKIIVIADEAVDPKFGTGVIKVTPAHDPTDFEIGQRHNLEVRQVIGFDGKLNQEAGKFVGLTVTDAREKVVAELEKKGLLAKVDKTYIHSVGRCQRCDTVVEPMVSEQWFIKMKPLAESAIGVVKEGKIKIIPKRFEKIYFRWLTNIRDWCISRQLWWGHKIPIEGEDGVLDTWFSSSLWPFATLGWPKETADLKYFYPTTVMETGYDILFFWVARMIMMGLEMTGEVPFKTVYLHGLIRDPEGLKMSKSKGNVIDPMAMAAKYGTDALRLSLVIGNTPGKDMRISEPKIQGMRNFTNKLWNIGRFIIEFALEGISSPQSTVDSRQLKYKDDQWIINELGKTIESVTNSIEKYQFSDAGQTLYDFIWHQFADKYIETSKERRTEAQPVLEYVFKTSLELLHPFAPFITEELWQRLPHEGESVMITSWPVAKS